MSALALLFTLASIGIAESAYLIRKRKENQKPVCPVGGGCQVVLASKYNKLLLIPNDTLGLLFYVIVSVMAGLLVLREEPVYVWNGFLNFLVLFGLIMSGFLTYLQWKVIKSWCFWCVMSAATVAFMAIILLTSGFDLSV